MRLMVILLVFFVPVFSGYSPGIRSNGDLDQFIIRLSSRYDIEVPRSFYSKPMHASEIMAFLDKADSLDNAGKLTRQESFQLKNIRKIISGQRSLFNTLKKQEWETENYFNLSLISDIAPYYQESAEVQMKGIINPRLSGATGKLSYFSEVGVWTEYRSDSTFPKSSYQPFDGNPYNLNGRVKASSTRSSDLFRGGISYEGRRFDLETAVDYLRMGPAMFYPLTFSGEYSPVTYFRARMELSAFEYVHTFGMLKMQKDRPKYFYTHRLDFPLFKNRLMVGINEVIINGSTAEKAQKDSLRQEYYGVERDWEWVYMIPFIPYKFAEHYLGDRDNGVLSFDLCLFYPSNFRWYAEFLLDDISSPLTLFSDDWGNKWAFTAGAQFFGTIAERDITVSFEYSRIEPWVYTHFCGGSHTYAHYGQSLGSPMGPNSDALVLMGEYAVGRRNSLGLFLKNTRKGRGRGSSITDVFQEEDPGPSTADSEKKEFLGDNYTRFTTFGVLWKYNPFGIFNVTAEVSYDSDEKAGGRVNGGFAF